MDRQDKPRWGDKTPPYSEWMRVLDRCLPEAHFVHLIRDGRELSLPRTARALRAVSNGNRVERWRTEIAPHDRAAFERVAGPLRASLGYELGSSLPEGR